MAASQRRKGAVGERAAAEFWSTIFPNAHRRSSGEESQADQGRDLAGTYPLAIQVKTCAHPNPLAALAEAVRAVHPSEIPVAHIRRVTRGVPAGEEPVCVLRARDLRRLVAVREALRATMPRRVEEIERRADGGGE